MRVPFAAAAAAFLLCVCTPPAPAQMPRGPLARPTLAEAIDSIALLARAEQAIPGLSIAVVKDGRVVAERGYGWADAEARAPATTATLYQIGSVTKQLTAAAVLRLVEEGRVVLSDPVTRHVDGLGAAYRDVTIERLLDHTAGVPNFTEFVRDVHAPVGRVELVGALRGRRLDFAPGTGFHYSNSGYYLLGLVIERASGEPYGAYLREQFFAPLEMASTGVCGAHPQTPVPAGYRRTQDGTARSEPWDMGLMFAAGALCSTAGDLARWEAALAAGRVVRDPALFRRMTTPTGAAPGYGFGLRVGVVDGERCLHHDGGLGGFRAQAALYPDAGVAVVVLTNAGFADPARIERAVARAVLGWAGTAPTRAE